MGFKTALITLLAVLPIGYGLFCVISKSTPLIHGYHVAQVAESNKERFSVFVGMGTIVFGIGIACRVLPPLLSGSLFHFSQMDRFCINSHSDNRHHHYAGSYKEIQWDYYVVFDAVNADVRFE